MARLGAGSPPGEALDLERWDRELADDLYGLALTMAPETAAPVAEAFGIPYDLSQSAAFLKRNADLTAASFNARTLEHLSDAYGTVQAETPKGRSKSTRQALRDAGAEVFDAADARAGFLANERAKIIEQYSRNEAASQAGAKSKRWVTPHPKARPSHQALNGVAVPFASLFPNGAKYPRDPKLPVGERAGCTCYVDYHTADVDHEQLDAARRSMPGHFKSVDDAKAWAKRNGLSLDDFDRYDNVPIDTLNELARRTDDLLGRYPWMRPEDIGDNVIDGFRGWQGIETAPHSIVSADFAVERPAWAVTWRDPLGFGSRSGVHVTVDLERVGAGTFRGSFASLSGSDVEALTHELGHVVALNLRRAPGASWGASEVEAAKTFKRALELTYKTTDPLDLRLGLIRDFGTYAAKNTDEAFAELFLASYDPTVYGRLTPEGKASVRTFVRTFNRLAGFNVFPMP